MRLVSVAFSSGVQCAKTLHSICLTMYSVVCLGPGEPLSPYNRLETKLRVALQGTLCDGSLPTVHLLLVRCMRAVRLTLRIQPNAPLYQRRF